MRRAESMPMQTPMKLLDAICPVLCPEGRGRAYGTKWEHHHGMPKEKKCRRGTGGQETPQERRFLLKVL